jgi:hypothetical protein
VQCPPENHELQDKSDTCGCNTNLHDLLHKLRLPPLSFNVTMLLATTCVSAAGASSSRKQEEDLQQLLGIVRANKDTYNERYIMEMLQVRITLSLLCRWRMLALLLNFHQPGS